MSDSAVATSASPVVATPATVEKKVVQKKASGSGKAKKAPSKAVTSANSANGGP
ncbi:GM13530 [Drosophila sechellia]|uniref:GM13530 n=1 Tax=Drosophila sechellia TaxID=7238 RepID=B4IQC1_DROSE|nr:GM13530 [Drosophila sechellia]